MESRELTPRAPRIVMTSPVDLFFGDGEARLQVLSVNVSTTGMLVRSETLPPDDASITFGFSLFEGEGEIVWSAETEQGEILLGMKFVSIGRGKGREENASRVATALSSRATERARVLREGPGFAEVTGRLLQNGVTMADLAFALGESAQAIHRGRLDSGAPEYRAPPFDWRFRLAPLARGRGEKLARLARELEEREAGE